MGQSSNYAALKDAKILPSKEGCVLSTGQRSKDAAVKDARINSKKEECVEGMGQTAHEESARYIYILILSAKLFCQHLVYCVECSLFHLRNLFALNLSTPRRLFLQLCSRDLIALLSLIQIPNLRLPRPHPLPSNLLHPTPTTCIICTHTLPRDNAKSIILTLHFQN